MPRQTTTVGDQVHDDEQHDHEHDHDHHHDHVHDHGHGHDDTHGAAFFDEAAATWDEPAKVERAATVAAAIVGAVAPGPATRLLEYGAGTGLVTEALRDHVGPVTLADASEGMRSVMASKVAAGALPADARIWALDLAADPVPDEQFDLIVTVMVLHHIADLDRVLAAFRRLLAPGGHLCIVDLDHEDGSFHGDGFAGHHGFHRPTLAAQLTAAGFAEPAFSDCAQMVRDGVSYDLFLAVAAAPAPVDAGGSS